MPTQKEIAKYAGVSSGTVSNVISGSTPVSDAARKKVLAAVEALNYEPNLMARSLKTNRSYTLGIIVPDITIPFFPEVIRGADLAARDRGQFLLVVDSRSSHELEVELLALLRQRVDGILLVTSGDREWSPELLKQIASGPPLVCVDRRPEWLNVDSVCVDDSGAAEMGTTHLIEKGYREIAVITGPLTLKNEQERLEGYKRALRKSSIAVRKNLIWSAGFEQNEIDAVCQRGMLASAAKPTALLATNGVTGLRALRSIYSMGFSTPEDIAFVTIDELMIDRVFKPTITSVIQPTSEIGYRAVGVLMDRIAHREKARKPSITRLPAKLVVRDSSQKSWSPAVSNSTKNTK